MSDPKVLPFLDLIERRLPGFALGEARLLPASGQFNAVLCIDDRWIFRFPKSSYVAADLDHELKVLPNLHGLLPLPIPDPQFSARGPDSGLVLFMGYPMLPGEPLLRERFATLQGDEGIVEQIAIDLADFLRSLHAIPPAAIGLDPAPDRTREEWVQTYDDLRDKLYPYMRAEAQIDVSRHFEDALDDSTLWSFEPCLIHGDFGTGNILYRAGKISGIIDFSFCACGDPAQDLGALIASYGEDFVDCVCRHYPALCAHRPRALFYCGTYALLQALFALRDGDQAEIDDGIAAYR